LIEAPDLLLRLFEMIAQPLAQFAIGGLVDQTRERSHNLVLGIIDVLQAMEQQIIHRLDIFRKQAHVASPVPRRLTLAH
jgi:hypothetical protein